jgi:hypothetical protein
MSLIPIPGEMVVEVGASGASHTLRSSPGTSFLPGQPLWLSAFIRAERPSGTKTVTVRRAVEWRDAANALVSTTFDDTVIGATIARTFFEAKHVAPAGAVSAEVVITVTPSAAPMGHEVGIAKVRLGRTQVAADITAAVVGPANSSFAHSAAGVAETGEFPRSLPFKLVAATGTILSGIAWSYLVKSGTVNGFANADGAQAISGDGAVTLDVASLGTSSAEVEVRAAHQGVVYPFTHALGKTFAAPNNSGSGGSGSSSGSSQSSGFGTVGSAWATISNELNATLGTGKTQVDIAINLSATPVAASPAGLNNIEFKVQKLVAAVWTDEGAAMNSAPDASVLQDPDTGEFYVAGQGTLSGTVNDTGETSGTTQTYRVQARYTTGSANHAPLSLTGNIIVSVP